MIFISAVTLLLSVDYHNGLSFILNFMPVSVYILIAVGTLLFDLSISQPNDKMYLLIVMLCFFVITQSRVEGGIYIVFFLSCFINDYVEKGIYKTLLIICLIWELQWNLVQYICIGNVAQSIFWTPKKAMVIFIGFGALVLVYNLINCPRINHYKLVYVFKEYYNAIFLICIFIMTIFLCAVFSDISIENVKYHIRHIAINKCFWLFIYSRRIL